MTNNLRQLVTSLLTPIAPTFYEVADADIYPHIVFTVSKSFSTNRDDYDISIDVWDKSISALDIESKCDSIEQVFNNLNNPTLTMLPTFYVESRNVAPDEDRKIRHRHISISCQSYERSNV